MRLAVLADIHGNLPALEAVIEGMNGRCVDAVINLGDSLSGPLFPLETAQLLLSQPWTHLAGNHERQLLSDTPNQFCPSDAFTHAQLWPEHFLWLSSLQATLQYNESLFLCHGTPTCDLDYLLHTVDSQGLRDATEIELAARIGEVQAQVIVCGHSHVAGSSRRASGQLIVNPGSVGLPAYLSMRPYPHVMENASPNARYDLLERSRNQWTVTPLSVSYPHHQVAALALSRERPDWAYALSSGYAK